MWLLFAILAPLCWSFANPIDAALRRTVLRDDFVMTMLFAAIKLPVAIILFVACWSGMIFGWPFLWIFFAGIIWMLGFVFYYRAMQIEEVSRVVLILQFQPILIFVVAAIMINETLTLPQLASFLLIFAGSILAALRRTQKRWHFSSAFLMMIFADLIWSFADVIFKKYAVVFPDFWTAFAVNLLGSSALGAFFLFLPKYRRICMGFKWTIRAWWLFIFSAVVGTLGSFLFAYALTIGKATLTSVIIGFQPLMALFFTLFLGSFIKEIPKESITRNDLLLKGASFLLILIGLGYLYF